MSSLALGLGLAVLASIALNVSYLLQHVGAADAPDVDARHPFATVRGLLCSRLWAAGAVLGVTGWGLHVAALCHAPLSLVQGFVAGTLGLMAPFAARALRQRLDAREWLAVAIVALSLVMLSLGLHNHRLHSAAPPPSLYAFVGAAALASIVLVFGVRTWRAHALGLAGGALYGAADTAIKALTGVAAHGGLLRVVSSPALIAAVLTTACAFFAFQRGLQTGRAIPVVVLMTGATTVVSVAGGFVVFGDPLGRTPLLAALHLLGFALVTVGSALLAPAAHPPETASALDVECGRPELVGA